MNAFAPADQAVGISELARRSGLPKATVHRLVAELTTLQWLERTASGSVVLGLRLFELGQRAARPRSIRDAALPTMEDLREATGQTIHLAVLDGVDVVYVEILRSRDRPVLPSRVGGRLPAHATGVGKAILAFSPRETVTTILGHGLASLSPRTITMPGMLQAELGQIRRCGVAFDREESGIGTACVASPILGAGGSVVAALSVSGWSSKVPIDRMVPAVRTAALTVSRRLNTLSE